MLTKPKRRNSLLNISNHDCPSLTKDIFSGGRSASFCWASYHSQATSPKFSLFCQHLCISYGEGLWYNLFFYKVIFCLPVRLFIRSLVKHLCCRLFLATMAATRWFWAEAWWSRSYVHPWPLQICPGWYLYLTLFKSLTCMT